MNIDIRQDIIDFFVKIIIPAIAGITIKLSVMMEKEKLTFLKVFISLIIGIGFVYLLQQPVKNLIPEHYQPLMFGLIAMSGETLGRFITKLYSIDIVISSIYKNLINYITKLTGMERIFKNIVSTILGIAFIYFAISKSFDNWIIIFLIMMGVLLIFSKDTLFSKLGKFIDTVLQYFAKKNE